MILIIRILPHSNFNQNLWAGAYRYLEPLGKNTLHIPLKVFICKRLHIEVNESQIICSSCTKTNYYIGSNSNTNSAANMKQYCFNMDCSKFSSINLDDIPIYNNGGEIQHTLQYVEYNSELRNNSNIVAINNCNKCNSCKQCTKKKFESNNTEKCKRHQICTHTKNSFRKRDMLHSLNLLSHERAKSKMKHQQRQQRQHQQQQQQ